MSCVTHVLRCLPKEQEQNLIIGTMILVPAVLS
jgi:hypothetical protein